MAERGMAVFIRVFDLEAAECIADGQRDRLTKTGSSKKPYLFSIPITDSASNK
jgi:hypothetical protein